MYQVKLRNGKLLPVNVTKTYGGWGSDPLIFNIDTRRGEWSTSRPRMLYHWRSSVTPYEQRQGGTPSLSVRHGEQKNMLPLPGIKIWRFDCPPRSLIIIQTAQIFRNSKEIWTKWQTFRVH